MPSPTPEPTATADASWLGMVREAGVVTVTVRLVVGEVELETVGVVHGDDVVADVVAIDLEVNELCGDCKILK